MVRRLLAGRRRFLASAAALMSVPVCGPGLPWATSATPADGARGALLDLLAMPQARLLGLAAIPLLNHPTADAVMRSLSDRLGGFHGGDLFAVDDAGRLSSAFQAAVKDDFANGRCTQVDGWVLANAELELCALAALS